MNAMKIFLFGKNEEERKYVSGGTIIPRQILIIEIKIEYKWYIYAYHVKKYYVHWNLRQLQSRDRTNWEKSTQTFVWEKMVNLLVEIRNRTGIRWKRWLLDWCCLCRLCLCLVVIWGVKQFQTDFYSLFICFVFAPFSRTRERVKQHTNHIPRSFVTLCKDVFSNGLTIQILLSVACVSLHC